LLPPTLIASIYGMNMQIPEVQALGSSAYPFVVALMLTSAILPMWYFRRRGWLKG
jgi:magnesium transporter